MDKLNQKVERILRTKPQTRNDDFLLINEVYKEYISTQSMSFDLLSRMHRELELPPFESITRARRKIQKENEDLKACDVVELARTIQEEKYRDYYKK